MMTAKPAWNDNENAALVALYFTMLDAAQAGRPYCKAAMIRSAQRSSGSDDSDAGAIGAYSGELTGRTKQSVEFKLMNASACHRDVYADQNRQAPPITMDGYGYRAMPNYQAALRDAMAAEIEYRKDADRQRRNAG